MEEGKKSIPSDNLFISDLSSGFFDEKFPQDEAVNRDFEKGQSLIELLKPKRRSSIGLESLADSTIVPIDDDSSQEAAASGYIKVPRIPFSADAMANFLATIDISLTDLAQIDRYQYQSGTTVAGVRTLLQQETSRYSWCKWSTLDHIIEKMLQWPLLSFADVSGTLETCSSRVKPQERAILLKRVGGLIKAYGIHGFIQGVSMGLLESVDYFVSAMLAYRLADWGSGGHLNLVTFQTLSSRSTQKGTDTLVHLLSHLETSWLKLILTTPLLIGVVMSLGSIYDAKKIRATELNILAEKITMRLDQPGSFWRNTLQESLPLFANLCSLSKKILIFESIICWDGRLSAKERLLLFTLVHQMAMNGKQIVQLNAIACLAKIVHGISLKDLPRLQQAGYTKADLLTILHIKTMALHDLELLSQTPAPLPPRTHWWEIYRQLMHHIVPIPRRVYASYALWWLGLATSFWKQRLPFTAYKTVKLLAEIYLLEKIVSSILVAIYCPDKPGFKFAHGYEDWAADYTVACFTTRMSLFRTIFPDESVADLVAEISQYHLTELNTLNLSGKYLTVTEVQQIIHAVMQKGALLQRLDLSDNLLTNISAEVFAKLANLQILDLSYNPLTVLKTDTFIDLTALQVLYLNHTSLEQLNAGAFSGLGQLQTLVLSENDFFSNIDAAALIDLVQLHTLELSICQISSLDLRTFSTLHQLKTLDLSYNYYLNNLHAETFFGLNNLETLNLRYTSQLQHIPADVFMYLPVLRILDLSLTDLMETSIGILSGLKQLQVLRLEDSGLTSLYAETFAELNQLQELDLARNYLSYANLSADIFSALSQLKKLDLSDNGLTSLPAGIFTKLDQLQALVLHNNFLNSAEFIDSLQSIPALTLLDISFNDIDHLPDDFAQHLPSSLSTLLIGGNPIIPTTLNAEFMRYLPTTLTTLSIVPYYHHGIVNITANAFANFSRLISLDLSFNILNGLDDKAFSGLENLQELFLNDCQFSSLSAEIFTELRQLNKLYLRYSSNLQSIHRDVFSGLNKLHILDLSRGNFSIMLAGVFSALHQLTWLSLMDSRLTDAAIVNITQGFPYQLQYLDIRFNPISDAGVAALVAILPCTDLNTFLYTSYYLSNNTALALQIQQDTLKKICADQICHANLPATAACGVTTEILQWGSGGSIEVLEDETDISSNIMAEEEILTVPDLYAATDLHLPLSAELSLHPSPTALPNPAKDSTQITVATAGALIIGVIGLGILLYKNCTSLKTLVDNGYRVLQNWAGGAEQQPIIQSEILLNAQQQIVQMRDAKGKVNRHLLFSHAASVVPKDISGTATQKSAIQETSIII